MVGHVLDEVEPGVAGSIDPAVHQDLGRARSRLEVLSRSGHLCGTAGTCRLADVGAADQMEVERSGTVPSDVRWSRPAQEVLLHLFTLRPGDLSLRVALLQDDRGCVTGETASTHGTRISASVAVCLSLRRRQPVADEVGWWLLRGAPQRGQRYQGSDHTPTGVARGMIVAVFWEIWEETHAVARSGPRRSSAVGLARNAKGVRDYVRAGFSVFASPHRPSSCLTP